MSRERRRAQIALITAAHSGQAGIGSRIISPSVAIRQRRHSNHSVFESCPQREESAMTRLPVIAAAVLAIAASAPLVCTTTSPASAQGWHGRDGDVGSDLRDLLRDRIQTREDLRDLIIDLLRDRQEMRGRLRERMGQWRDREEDEDDGGWHGGLRGRLAERLAERRGGGEGGGCYFLTRSLSDEDRDFILIIRRRVCRD